MMNWSINILVFSPRPERLSRFNRLMAPFRLSVCDGTEHRQLLNRWLNYETFDLVVIVEPEQAYEVASILYQTRHSFRNKQVPVVILGGTIPPEDAHHMQRRGLAAMVPILPDPRRIVSGLYGVWLLTRQAA
jgi:hypothetical protein